MALGHGAGPRAWSPSFLQDVSSPSPLSASAPLPRAGAVLDRSPEDRFPGPHPGLPPASGWAGGGSGWPAGGEHGAESVSSAAVFTPATRRCSLSVC